MSMSHFGDFISFSLLKRTDKDVAETVLESDYFVK